MENVAVERKIDAPAEDVRDAILNLKDFMKAAGFDRVEVDGDRIEVANQVGPKTIELELEVVEEFDGILAYRQVEGIFEEMETRYYVKPTNDATEVKAETDFVLDVAVVGSFLDSTVIKMQRKRELDAQFDYLEDQDTV
ncbi:MAG: SRPBCC family protein [Halobacteria archaeon]|nr:SRPBCC family protein [Halobacteria archaeon]